MSFSFLLAVGHTDPPPLDFVWPWALAPPVGTVLAVLAVARYRGRFRYDGGLRRYAGLALDGLGLLWTLARTGTRTYSADRSGKIALPAAGRRLRYGARPRR